VAWENTTNEGLLEQAREEIRKSWRRTCADNQDHPRAAELFNPDKLPAFHDPFAGGGSLPLEAQRLGLEAYASDLNPVAVLINKAMIEIPPRFAGRPPVNPEAQADRSLFARQWKGAEGLAEDVRYYGKWMRDEAEKRIGHLYPKVEITAEMISPPPGGPGGAPQGRPDLTQYLGQKLTVIAWLWARTVKSPNPAFAHVDVPLVSTFMLATKPGKEAYLEPVVEGDSYRFEVRVGKPKDLEAARAGTKLGRGANFRCVMSGAPITGDDIKAEGQAGRMGARMMAIVAEGAHGRVYLAPTAAHEEAARQARPAWKPETLLADDPRNLWTIPYGLTKFCDLFTPRQLAALTTLADLVGEARERIQRDAVTAGMACEGRGLDADGVGSRAYAEGVGVYLGLGLSKLADYNSSLVSWSGSRDQAAHVFTRQALPMVWDFAEVNPLAGAAGDLTVSLLNISRGLEASSNRIAGFVVQEDAAATRPGPPRIFSTDPPYYDNIGYADLSDYFYVWLRRSQQAVFPDLFATLAVPKAEELVATPYRHGGREAAEAFFLKGMTRAMATLAAHSHPACPTTIYYAFKQSESDAADGTASTGWETFLEAVAQAGFSLSGTWPIRTERGARSIGIGSNALASSIVLVCRPRPADAPTATRREFLAALKTELPVALRLLQKGNIAPVDLQQAAIGPGMSIFTRYSKVEDATGKTLSVREALTLINQTLDEVLAEQEGDFDSDTRWALAWFDQYGFAEGEFGVAETLSKAKNTSVTGMVEAGVAASGAGKVRLLKPAELPTDWDPTTDTRLTVWEMVHHLVRALDQGGERRGRGTGGEARLSGRDGSRAGLPPLLRVRAQEARHRGAGLQRPGPELARAGQPGPGGRPHGAGPARPVRQRGGAGLMLTRLHVRNFKSWEDTGEMRLAPLTALFGANSSGKTSLLQVLLMLKQTADSPDRSQVLNLGDERSLVELGTFQDVLCGHDLSRSLDLELEWTLPETLQIRDPASKNSILVEGDTLAFANRIAWQARKEATAGPVVTEMSYRLGDMSFGMRQKAPANGQYELAPQDGRFRFVRTLGRSWPLPPPARCYGFPDQARAYHQNAGFLSDLELGFENCLGRVFYLGPLRDYPRRHYLWAGAQPADMGRRGEKVVDALLASRESGLKLSAGRGRRRLTLEERVARWLQELGLIQSFQVRPVTEGGKLFQVWVRRNQAGAEVLLPDVGFGVSQVLPVITLCYYAPEGSTLILEQPEIHLHPAVQSGLADVLLDAVRTRGVQILLESHSEHLLKRLQRRMAEETARPEDLALYFCSTEDGRSRLTELQLDLFGQVQNWPQDFFGDPFGEMAETQKKILERKIAARPQP